MKKKEKKEKLFSRTRYCEYIPQSFGYLQKKKDYFSVPLETDTFPLPVTISIWDNNFYFQEALSLVYKI